MNIARHVEFSQWGSISLQVAALVSDMACCVFIRKKTFSTIQNNLAFIWDKCCHLMTRLHLMEPHCIPQEFGFSLVNTPRVLGSKLKNKRLAPALAASKLIFFHSNTFAINRCRLFFRTNRNRVRLVSFRRRWWIFDETEDFRARLIFAENTKKLRNYFFVFAISTFLIFFDNHRWSWELIL